MMERDYVAEQTQQQMPPGILGTRPGAIPHPMQSFILSDPVIDRLASALPPYPISGWRQLFSTEAHGFSLNSLYGQADGSGASILAVLTMQGDVFGAFLAGAGWEESLVEEAVARMRFVFQHVGASPLKRRFRWSLHQKF